MKTQTLRFKHGLHWLLAAFIGAAGAALAKDREPEAILRIHQEVPKESSGKSQTIGFMRSKPTAINVEHDSFLDERYITNAAIVDAVGGVAIELSLSATGARLLEQYSSAHRGYRLVLFCQWGDPKAPAGDPKALKQRWIAAPLLTRTIMDGKIRFTPDTTDEEAKTIVAGLKNTVRKHGKLATER
jgi:hypothetical protein